MRKYRVLWFDDEWEEIRHIIEMAKLNNIVIQPVDNASDGIAILRRDLEKFDAVIVDGLFHKTKGAKGDPTDDALNEVGKFFLEEKKRKEIPWFILSGQRRIDWSKNSNALVFKAGKVYDKLENSDLEALWAQLKKEADNQLDTQTRHNFYQVFDALTFFEIPPSQEKHLLDILKSISNPGIQLQDTLYFTQLRIILEQLFRAANKQGLLHDKCIENGKVNLSESSLFLSGESTKHLNVKCRTAHFPKIISDAVRSIIFISGSASHTVEGDQDKQINLQELRKTNPTPYLLYSLTFQLFDIIIWFKSYCLHNPDVAANKMLWESNPTSSTSSYSGVINQDSLGNFYCGPYLLPGNLKGYKVGVPIRILNESANTTATKFTYPKFASKLEKDI